MPCRARLLGREFPLQGFETGAGSYPDGFTGGYPDTVARRRFTSLTECFDCAAAVRSLLPDACLAAREDVVTARVAYDRLDRAVACQAAF